MEHILEIPNLRDLGGDGKKKILVIKDVSFKNTKLNISINNFWFHNVKR
jgi:hypothetical protein